MATINLSTPLADDLYYQMKTARGGGAGVFARRRADDWGGIDPVTAISPGEGIGADVALVMAAPARAGFPAVFRLSDINRTIGSVIAGGEEGDASGRAVSSAGDFNGDGLGDFIIGAPFADPRGVDSAGTSYVVFGKARGFGDTFYLDDLNGRNGFRIQGINVNDQSGFVVSSAGDVNGDGLDDIIIAAGRANPGGRPFAGEVYVVFGTRNALGPSIDLQFLNLNGFRIGGIDAVDTCGSAASAGDVNGDGVDDIIIGASRADPNGVGKAGESYVIFGNAEGFSPRFDLESLDGSNGFVINGVDRFDYSGTSVSSAGDVNGDGFDDVIIGASRADPGGDSYAGESYVVFGKAGGHGGEIDLASLNGRNGFRIVGVDADDLSGYSVSSAGDVNGDGFDDIIIGALGAGDDAGESYVVFGEAGGFAATLDLATLDGGNGFRIDGISSGDHSGFSVSSAGDVNGDGFDDIIIGAPDADVSGVFGGLFAGQSYVVFGKADGFAASLDLATRDGSNGFRIDGQNDRDYSGRSVSGAGDINGDGFDDIIVGADGADNINIGQGTGQSYVLYGRAPTGAVNRIGSSGDQTILGGDFDDMLSGDGGDDTLMGGRGADTLTGGTGHDRFLLTGVDGFDADKITDFTTGKDLIAFDNEVIGLSEGALAAGAFTIGTAANNAANRLIYDDLTGRLFYDADGIGAQTQVLIATLDNTPVLTAADFIVI